MRTLQRIAQDMSQLIADESPDVPEQADVLLREACCMLAAVADPQRANDGRVAARVAALTLAHASITTRSSRIAPPEVSA